MSRIGVGRLTSRTQDVIFDQIVQAALIRRTKSVIAIYGSVNPNRLMHHLYTDDGSLLLMKLKISLRLQSS